jgi:hypothetical protein
MGLVPHAVPGLLGRRPVEAQAVGLDDQAEIGPVEVDLEAVQPHARLWLRQPEVAHDPEEAALEFRVGQRERPAVENLSKGPDPGLARSVVQGFPKRLRIAEIALVGLVDRRLERFGLEPWRDVDDGPERAGNGDAAAGRDLLRLEAPPPVNDDALRTPLRTAHHGHLELARGRDDPPQGSRGHVAEDGVWPASEDSGHPPPIARHVGAPDGIHPSPHRMEPPTGDPMDDPIATETELQQLPARYHPVLPACQRP